MNALPIDADELAWAQECAAAGDSLADIARASGRTVSEWASLLPNLEAVPDLLEADEAAILKVVADLVGRRAKLAWRPAFDGLFAMAPAGWTRPATVTVSVGRTGSAWHARFRAGRAGVWHLRTRLVHLMDGRCAVAGHSAGRSFYVPSERVAK